MIPNRNKTLVGLPRLFPELAATAPVDDHEPFELRARMVRLPDPARRKPFVSTHTRLKHPAPERRASEGLKEFAVSAAVVFLLGCVALAMLSGCSTRIGGSPHQPDAAEDDPCAPAPSQCIDHAREAALAYQEPPLRALEAQTFCGVMLTTLPLSNAASRMRLAESTRRLVNVCYERGRLPLAEAMACSEALHSADESAGAAIHRYSDATAPLMAEMTREQAIAFTRATSAALDGQLPFGRTHECVGGAGEP